MADYQVSLQRIGREAGIILPEEVIEVLGAELGDTLNFVRTDRGYELIPDHPPMRDAMSGFEAIRAKHRNAFKELG